MEGVATAPSKFPEYLLETKDINWNCNSTVESLVQSTYDEIEAGRDKIRAASLKKELIQSHQILRDAKAIIREAQGSVSAGAFPRLPSTNSTDKEVGAGLQYLPFCNPSSPSAPSDRKPPILASSSYGSSDQIEQPSKRSHEVVLEAITKSGASYKRKNVCHRPIFLEGCQKAPPKSNASTFLKTHILVEDSTDLMYVPYFDDDQKDDFISELYDLKQRERMLEGLESKNELIDETIILLMGKVEDNVRPSSRTKISPDNTNRYAIMNSVVSQIIEHLANIVDVSEERVQERYDLYMNKKANDDEQEREKETLSKLVDANTQALAPKSLDLIPEEDLKGDKPDEEDTYAKEMDSYKSLFCRKCFSYDCNLHGNLEQANNKLQMRLALEKEAEGGWVSPDTTSTNAGMDTLDQSEVKSLKRSHEQTTCNDGIASSSPTAHKDLTPFEKSVFERTFQMFKGDAQKISSVLGCNISAVEDYMRVKQFELFKPTEQKPKKKKRRCYDAKSMKNYNPTWLNRFKNTKVHPVFEPCIHDEPCSSDNCSCVGDAFFCTKHCVWGNKSRNFFRGCNCVGGCNKNSCSCYASRRECDPDLCKNCGCCTDPPNSPATKQICRNDNIGMRRHCHLLLAESSVEDAGWGIYTKNALKKGDYIHEYLGELISHEEAERRGKIYDRANKSYLFNLNADYVIDAFRKGNKTRFVNHSSTPNSEARIIFVNGDFRIGLFAKQDIPPQTEIFFNYRYDDASCDELQTQHGKKVSWLEGGTRKKTG